MTYSIPFKVQELLNSRFCHDLANSLGTLQLSVDNLIMLEKKQKKQDNDLIHEKTINLITRSTNASLAKHQFYRFAYGNPDTIDGYTLKEISKIIEKFNTEKPFHFVTVHESIILKGTDAKLLLNLYLLSMEILSRGGVIKTVSDDQQTVTALSISGDEYILPDCSDSLKEKITVKNVQYYYTTLLAEQLNKKISIENNNDDCFIYIINK